MPGGNKVRSFKDPLANGSSGIFMKLLVITAYGAGMSRKETKAPDCNCYTEDLLDQRIQRSEDQFHLMQKSCYRKGKTATTIDS